MNVIEQAPQFDKSRFVVIELHVNGQNFIVANTGEMITTNHSRLMPELEPQLNALLGYVPHQA